jgi:hypothetical protein
MQGTKRYGIDASDETVVAWCRCGWRDIALNLPAARTHIVDHMTTFHGEKESEIMRVRSEKQRQLWAGHPRKHVNA